MTSFSSLPQEVIDIIITHLIHRDYASCVLVSHAWRSYFTPSLWRTVRVVDETANNCLKTQQGRNALARYSQYIREFETTYLGLVFYLTIARPAITKLVSLTIRLKDHRFSKLTAKADQAGDVPKSVTSSVIKVLKNNPGLRSLNLDRGCFRYKDDEGAFEFLTIAIPTARLERLELSFFDSHWARDLEGAAITDSAATASSITYTNQFLAGVKLLLPINLEQDRFFSLKEIAITGNGIKASSMDPIRLSFLVRCPNLERIRLDRLDHPTMACLPILLKMACHRLDCLELTNCTNDIIEPLVDLLQASKRGWKELRLPSMYALTRLGLAMLLDTSSETLEVLRIENAEDLLRRDTVGLLSSTTRLRRLEGPSDGQVTRFTSELTVDAYENYQEYVDGQKDRAWAVGPSMEYMQLSIQRVPRPDVVCRQGGRHLTFSQEGLDADLRFEVQRWIYTQLSKMTCLKELVLGKMDLDPELLASYIDPLLSSSMDPIAYEEALLMSYSGRGFQYLTMEFSLESGLDILEGMKELRVLDVRRTAHNIGVKELEWMHVNWPKLEKIRGLETERGWSVHRGEGKEFKAGVDAWMAAHPRGIGSSFYL
jgi:hypothetical protein